MRYLLVGAVIFATSITSTFAVDFSTVLTWMNINGLTKYDTIEEFRGAASITRGESSKFVNEYAQYMQLDKTYTDCTFSDIEDYDYTLVPHITEACGYGLLKGSQGKFMPNNNITQAQGITVVMRSLYGIQDETATPWWNNYYNLAKQAGIITNEDLNSMGDTILTREQLGTWFYAAAHLGGSQDTNKADDAMDEDTANAIAVEQGKTVTKTSTVSGPSGYIAYNETKVEQALAAGNKVYLFFHADRCPSCKKLDENLSNETNYPKDTVVFKINYDTATSLKDTYGIVRQHTIIKIDSNKNETHRNTTALDRNDIMEIGGNARI